MHRLRCMRAVRETRNCRDLSELVPKEFGTGPLDFQGTDLAVTCALPCAIANKVGLTQRFWRNFFW